MNGEKKCVTVLGAGPGNPGLLTVEAAQALGEAELLLGASRLLEELGNACAGEMISAVDAGEIVSLLREKKEWRRACVALSGDVGLFSGAKRLLEALEGEDYRVAVIPGISSAQYLAAKLRCPWQHWRFASAHGVSCDIPAQVRKGGTVFFVTGGENTVERMCASLCAAGLGETGLAVGERLSCPGERITTGTAASLAGRRFDNLSVLLAEYHGENSWRYVNTGIPDAYFRRGTVPMTKQEVRAAALAKLGISPGDVVYDIGAGTGSVSVEVGLLAGEGHVYAVERLPEAAELVRRNAAAFGLANVTVVEGEAPGALEALPGPDAAFVGGSGGSMREILACLKGKNPGVRVCIACITVENVALAAEILSGKGYECCEICQISVSRSSPAGGLHMMKALNPVTLVSARGVKAP